MDYYFADRNLAIEQVMALVETPVDEDDETSCWLWLGPIGSTGYGTILLEGERYQAHRIVYELLEHELPAGMNLRHRCPIPLCVRPSHLYYYGTKESNMPRGVKTEARTKAEILSLAQADPPSKPDVIATELGVSLNTVYRVLREANLIGAILSPERAHLSVEATAKMIERYLANEDVATLLQEYSLSQATFYRLLRDNNVPTRGELAQEQRRRALDDAINMYRQGIKIWRITQVTGISGYKLNKAIHDRDVPMRRADYGMGKQLEAVEAALNGHDGPALGPTVKLDPALADGSSR